MCTKPKHKSTHIWPSSMLMLRLLELLFFSGTILTFGKASDVDFGAAAIKDWVFLANNLESVWYNDLVWRHSAALPGLNKPTLSW